MSNQITAYFKGRTGVAEPVYQNDYGMVLNFDGIYLPSNFDCHFSVLGSDTAIPGVGADNRVAIPNTVLSHEGNVTVHIPLHTGSDDSEVEYVVYFQVIGRARPEDDGTPVQMTAIERALALLSQPITNIEEIVNEALSFTGETFDEMRSDLQGDYDTFAAGVSDDVSDMQEDIAGFKTEIRGDISDVEADFTVLQGQFDTAVAGVTTDTEVTDIRVGADGVTDTTAGASVRRQFTNLKSDINEYAEKSLLPFTLSAWESHGTIDSSGNDTYQWATARTTTIVSYTKDVIFTCDSGYRFFVAFYKQDGTFDYLSTLGTDDVLVKANTKFRLVMRLLPDGSGEASVLSKHIHIRDDSFLVNKDLEESNAVLSRVSETTQNLFTGENAWDDIGLSYSNGELTNTTTDTRNNLQLIVYILDESNTVLASSNTKSVTANGRVSLTVKAATAGKKIEIKHSGSSLDIKARYAFETEANQAYTFSCYVAGYNPRTVGGIVLEDIQIEKGATSTEYTPHFTGVDYVARGKVDSYARHYTDTNAVLWLGTSIPEGAQYPYRACEANGYSCINKSVGSSKLCFDNTYIAGSSEYKGRRLTATVAELEALYRVDVTNGIITEATLNAWKAGSYENSVLPYINGTADTQVSMIVVDHGFNDSGTIIEQLADVDNIDWASADRSTFTGAFRYLLNQIQAVNPFIKIVIAGYFQNTIRRLGNVGYYGDSICQMQELIGKHYDISVMKAWEHTQINGEFVSGTSSYIADFNATYGTSYTPMVTDASGNIPAIQLYCPDTIHPHTDRSGNTNRRLNAVYTKLLAHMI